MSRYDENSPRALIAKIRESYKQNCVIDMRGFWMPADESGKEPVQLTDEQKLAVETRLKDNFRIWWQTWVGPRLDMIEDRVVKNRKPIPPA
jgi:acyl-ACP thioesterase